jgi:hypothetical protein
MARQTVTFTANTTWTVPATCYKVEVFVLGGGGGGGGGGAAGGGGGGGGGRITLVRDFSVTPGQNITVVVGNGGTAGAVGLNGGTGGTSSFGTITAAGGSGGTANNGTGGASSRTIFGTTTNFTGSTGGGGGASPNASTTTKDGSAGYLYGSVQYAGGGGGGINTFTSATARPIIPGLGGKTGGGNGGGEDTLGTTNDSPAVAGTVNTGGGGGGGAASGQSQEYQSLNQQPNPVAQLLTAPATPGAAGGRGIVIVTFDEATFQIIPRQPGVSEGQTITVDIRANHVRNGVTVPYTISGTGITSEDFNPATLTGNFTISSSDSGLTGTGSVILTIANDSPLLLNETAVETAVVSLNSGLAVGSFQIGDFSRSPFSSIESKRIQVGDYNTIQSKVASVLGNSNTATADFGWGQVVRSSPVTESTKVGVTDWSNLRFDIINAWVHLYNTTPSLATVTENERIRGSVTDAPYGQYESYANVIVANRFGSLTPPDQFFIDSKGTVEQTWPGVAGTSWNTRIFATVRAAWPTPQAARHFFNAGGEIRFLPSHSGGSATNQVTAWNRLLNGVGSRAFGGAKPSIGTTPSNATNYYRLTSAFQAWTTVTASTPYSLNIFRINARSPGVPVNTSGEALSVEFQIEWVDGYTAGGGAADSVNGTFSVAITTLEPFGSLQPAGTGNFQVTSPTVTIVNQPQVG